MSSKTLVTGGGGFLGRGIVKACIERGDEVVTLQRGDYPELEKMGASVVRGSVDDEEAVARAMEGVERVFHVAAKVGASSDREAFYSANVTGTERIIAACKEAGADLIFTSSPSVVFSHGDLEGVDESHPYPEHYEALYPETKALAEQRVRAAHKDGVKSVSLRPHIIWGPGDTSLLPRLLARADRLRKIVTKGPPKRMDVTYIDDAVRAHLVAADRLREAPEVVSGKVYFISGETVEIWPFIDEVLVAAGKAPVKRSAPRGAAMAAGWVFETAHKLSGKAGEPQMSRWIVRELTTSHWFDTTAAKEDLGFVPEVDRKDGLKALADSLR